MAIIEVLRYTLFFDKPIIKPCVWMNWNDFNVMSLERWLASTFMPNWPSFIYFQDLSG